METSARNVRAMRVGTVRFTSNPAGPYLKVLRQNLPQLLHLKDLTIGQATDNDELALTWDHDHFLETLRTNGSVVRLSLNCFDLTAAVQKRVDAYLQRNESFPVLLANHRPRNDQKLVERGPAKNSDGPLDLSLLPSLFEVSKSMPAMSANMMLIGLLAAAGNSKIGPSTQDGKRAGFSDLSNR
jgi:hypothetical protein